MHDFVNVCWQVSLYGHSLGSVLSYDILCHQDSLSLTSPIDLAYRQPKNLTDLVGKNENACRCSSMTTSVHEAVPPDGSEENKPLAPSSPSEEKEPAECSSSVDHSTSSSDDPAAMMLRPYLPINQANGHYSDPMDMLTQDRDTCHEAMGMNCAILGGSLEKADTVASEELRDKEQEIDSLRKEVKSLTIGCVCD